MTAPLGSGRDVGGGGQGVANHGKEVSPAPDDPAVGDAVDDQLLGPDPPAGGGDAAEGPGVRPLTEQSRGDRVLLDDQQLQLPVVVAEGGADRLDALDVRGQPVDGRGPAHLLGDELAELIDAVLVAAGQVALIQGNHVSTVESHASWSHGANAGSPRWQ